MGSRGLNARARGGESVRRGNPIVAWLCDQRRPMREILEETATIDASMAQGLAQTYALRNESRRLGLTLFIQYTQAQGLSSGEVALLLGDAQAMVTEALNFLIGSALRESALTAVDEAVCCGEPVITAGLPGLDDPELRPPVL